jgi:MFS family permease
MFTATKTKPPDIHKLEPHRLGANGMNPGAVVQATLIAAALMPMLGGATIAPVLPQIRAEFADIPNGSTLTAMVLSTHALAILLLAPIAGWVGDRAGRKPALIAGLAGFTLAGTSGAWLPTLPAILAGRLLLGASIALLMTSMTGLVGDLFDEEHRTRLLARQQAAGSVGGLLFMLGAGALATLGWREAFGIYLAGAVVLIPVLLVVPHRKPSAPAMAAARQTEPGRIGRWLVAPVAAVFVIQALFYVIPTQIPGLFAREFGASPFQISLVLATMMLTMLPAALLYPRISEQVTAPRLVAAAFAAPALGFTILAAAQQVWALMAGLVIIVIGPAMAGPSLTNWVVTRADESVRGRAVGVLTTGLFAGQFLSPVITQPVIDTIGLRPTLLGLAIAATISAAGYAAMAHRARARMNPDFTLTEENLS